FFRNKRKTGRYFKFNSFAHNILLLQLFNISAYALNRSIAVFDISTTWLTVFLLVSNIMLSLYALLGDFKNKYLNHFFLLIASIAILFHFYESLYVMQVYPITALSFWFFGISLHSFVPLLMMIAYIKVVRRYLKKTEAALYFPTALTTWIASLFFVFLFTYRFHEVNQMVGDSFHESQAAYHDKSLPAWFSLSQKLKKDWISKRALLSGLTFSDAELWGRRSWGRRFNSRIEHDPLVVIASFFSKGIKIPINDRVKILRFLYNERHKTERKLWSDDNLSTSDIVTNVRLYPKYRLAYTEKVFKIHNSRVQRFGRPQEALYTFHLPEGAVVSSASLWVEGEERPAYLTTKSKADSAYQAIVGRERRDPLLIHWQEGNRVTARIFPCTPDEDRQFKIGFTTPLRKVGNQLQYENIDFEGPYWKTAEESIHIVCDSGLKNLSSPFSFRQDGTNYTYKGYYYSQWALTFDAPPLSQAAFSFHGKYYRLLPYLPEKESFAPDYYYLDIHSAWSKKECNAIWQQLQNKKVYVYSNHRMIALKEENKDALFKQLRNQNFTLFPFHKIMDAQSALVISKYSQETPTLDDLHESTFATQSSTFFQEANQPVKVFHLGREMSPYLSSLQELRCIQAETGDLERLKECLQNHQFWVNQENDNSIVNRYAGIQIVSGNNRP
ncbi:MAG TPA: XrtN system VIT domain-containing protein, partial [Phaeodactylibacter sp.]|nr:XrtN system VIT domain-containing protein [Phaeodactylibacter sp.]